VRVLPKLANQIAYGPASIEAAGIQTSAEHEAAEEIGSCERRQTTPKRLCIHSWLAGAATLHMRL